MSTALLFFGAFCLPLLASLSGLFWGRREIGNSVSHMLLALGGVLGLVASVRYMGEHFGTGASLTLPWTSGIFSINDLNLLFIALISLGVLLTSLYSITYLTQYATHYSLGVINFVSGIFVAAMLAVTLSTTVFSFLLFWEVMSVAVYFLVIADRSDTSLDAGLLYFVMTHLGFVSLLAGFLVLSGGALFASFADVALSAAALNPLALGTAFVLLFIGFGSKAGLVPFHRWLPAAHPAAPSGSSALLSGVMLKIAVFGFVQAMLLFPAIPLWYAAVVFVAGLVTAFFGALYAAVEYDLKRLLAWSSIENLGLIFSGLGALGIVHTLPLSDDTLALTFGVLFFVVVHTIAHSVFKTGLFMAAGAVVLETHTRDMDEMGGLARKNPWLSVLFLILALSAVALPPFVTFFGEWSYLQALALALRSLGFWYQVGAALALSIIALVGGLALFAFAKAFAAIFLGRGRSALRAAATDRALLVPITASAALVTVLGFFIGPLAASVFNAQGGNVWGAPIVLAPGAAVNPLALVALLALSGAAAYVLFRLGSRRVRMTDTWDCGQPLTGRMEYTATGFAAPIRFFFRGLVVSEKKLTAVPVVGTNPWIVRRTLSWDVTSLWSRFLYLPIGTAVFRTARFVSRLQNGSIQFYLLLVFGALIGVLAAAL